MQENRINEKNLREAVWRHGCRRYGRIALFMLHAVVACGLR